MEPRVRTRRAKLSKAPPSPARVSSVGASPDDASTEGLSASTGDRAGHRGPRGPGDQTVTSLSRRQSHRGGSRPGSNAKYGYLVRVVIGYLAVNFVLRQVLFLFPSLNPHALLGSGASAGFRNLYLSPFKITMELVVDGRHVLRIGDLPYEAGFSQDLTLELPMPANWNKTIYADVFLHPKGAGSDQEHAKSLKLAGMTRHRKEITRHMKERRKKAQRSLLREGFELVTDDDDPEMPVVAHWTPNITISYLYHPYNLSSPSVLSHFLHPLVQFHNNTAHGAYYIPPAIVNSFWTVLDDYYHLNDTLRVLPINLHVQSVPLWKLQGMLHLDASLRMQTDKLGIPEEEADENDIAFWKDRQENVEGISVRTVIWNAISQVVIFLYLIDNHETTSWLISLSTFVGLLIELWKIRKAVKITWKDGSYIPVIEDLDSYRKTDTKEADVKAFRVLSIAAVPLLCGYGVWSLLYETHKSWYSYIISVAVGFIYTFGFIMMTPQLYVNYVRKSVDGLPWRVLTFRFLNTIIDDLFAFIMRTPAMYKVMVFRDDVVFLIYLAQWWMYGASWKTSGHSHLKGE